jgi:hypothetical protein
LIESDQSDPFVANPFMSFRSGRTAETVIDEVRTAGRPIVAGRPTEYRFDLRPRHPTVNLGQIGTGNPSTRPQHQRADAEEHERHGQRKQV